MKQNVYINNGIALRMAPEYRVYTHVRSLDDRGAGQLSVSLTEVAGALDRKRKTIRRNLLDAEKRGLLSYLKLDGDTATLRYVSTLKLARDDSGLRSLVPTPIAINYLKEAATRAEACYRTRRHHAKLRLLPRRKASDPMFGKQILTYDNLLTFNCSWIGNHRNGYAIQHPQIVHAGASQQTVANALGVHRTTVNRRLRFCNENLCAQPHYRVHYLRHLIDLPTDVAEALLDESTVGRYTLAPNGVVWENSTCIYPFEPFGIPDPVPQEERAEMFHDLEPDLAIGFSRRPCLQRSGRRRPGG